MKITQEILNDLNDTLFRMGCKFKYKWINDYSENGVIPTIVQTIEDNNGFIDSVIINCNSSFYTWLDKFFKEKYDITLSYNNTRSICWSNDYS